MSDGAAHAQPNYWTIWAYLLLLTVVELGVAFLPWSKEIQLLVLLALAIWKALLVALYFMHLKFEGNRMRIFAIAPLPLTVIIIVAVLTEYVW
ncbi:MAG: cytochrome C oxidase subunit IV family protein [Gemmatimonadetes bacterium]|nr:cytochrome C oxidase subunit IV family protein [Gemmatimonadota bacterium]MCH8936143.1 cytochrome C oxidase subunit IV family protein [Gemmatimonadota bacterium]